MGKRRTRVANEIIERLQRFASDIESGNLSTYRVTRVPSVRKGCVFKKEGKRWRVVDDAAGILTLRNGKGEERILHPSRLRTDGYVRHGA